MRLLEKVKKHRHYIITYGIIYYNHILYNTKLVWQSRIFEENSGEQTPENTPDFRGLEHTVLFT